METTVFCVKSVLNLMFLSGDVAALIRSHVIGLQSF